MAEPEVIEAEATSLVVRRDPERGLARADTPKAMIALATELANALKDIVEGQRLYTIINGKKYPQVEAWMTIGRMDNVVAREAERPIRNDDGSYEAFVELVRLSDGMVVGRASAMCGSPDDPPWGGSPATKWKDAMPPRSEANRRSMAVTRATSRAFRQQYSWIMALAGYQPTPADEMPPGEPEAPTEPTKPQAVKGETETLLGELGRSRTGTIAKTKSRGSDLEARETPDGTHIGFRFDTPKGAIEEVWATGDVAAFLFAATSMDYAKLEGEHAVVNGLLYRVTEANRKTKHRLRLSAIEVLGAIYPPTVPTEFPAKPLPAEEAAELDALDVPWPDTVGTPA